MFGNDNKKYVRKNDDSGVAVGYMKPNKEIFIAFSKDTYRQLSDTNDLRLLIPIDQIREIMKEQEVVDMSLTSLETIEERTGMDLKKECKGKNSIMVGVREKK